MKAIIYRYNVGLATYASKLNLKFIHEFPAEMSIEEIAKKLPEILKQFEEQFGEPFYLAYQETSIDGTVYLAAILASEHSKQADMLESCARVIKQDAQGYYEIYAKSIADLSKTTGLEVIIVRECIADHNREPSLITGTDFSHAVRKSESRVKEVTDAWVNRLHSQGIKPIVVDKLYNDNGDINESIGNLSDKIIVVDNHHIGDCYHHLRDCKDIIKTIQFRFNAYPFFLDFGNERTIHFE